MVIAMATSEKLNAAFHALNKMGLVAKQNHWCCQSCAGEDIYANITERMKQGQPPPLGVCFYHEQDAEERDAYEDFYLSFGEGHPTKEDVPISQVEVGRRVVGVLFEHGVETEWNGDVDTRIKIVAASLWRDDPAYLSHALRNAMHGARDN